MKQKTGIELIAIERQEQIEKHKVLIENDVVENSERQLAIGAIALIRQGAWKDEFEVSSILSWMPENWNPNLCYAMAKKSYKDRLIIAGALIAAEIDRINYNEKLTQTKT